MNANDNKLIELEVLRGVAILLTVAAHLSFLITWTSDWHELVGGNHAFAGGVDLFFCISGYVITTSLMRRAPPENSWNAFKELAVPFWTKRIWRLWPSATLWLAVYMLGALFFNRSGSFGSVTNAATGTVAGIFQVSNFYFPVCVKAGNCGFSGIYWSLSLEEQFYLLFPFLFVFLSRAGLRIFLVVLILTQITIYRPIASPLWSFRTEAIAFGVLLAMTPQALPILRAVVNRLGRLSFLIFPLLCFALLWAPTFFLNLYPGVSAIVSVALVAVAALNQGALAGPGWLRTSLAYIGARSYAIYLCHAAVFLSVREIYFRATGATPGPEQALVFAVASIGLIWLVSNLNFRFVETPLRIHGAQIAARQRRAATLTRLRRTRLAGRNEVSTHEAAESA
jgi:peptidoglycan/LPS O-acetylase OafA/YrhL